MKNTLIHRMCLLAGLALFSTALISKSAEPAASKADQLKASAEKWKAAKAGCDGNYTYHVGWASFMGARAKTTIVVRNNKVVERRFEESSGLPQPVKPGEQPEPPKPKWVETGAEIGSHSDSRAGSAKTLDELYAEARKLVEDKVPEHHQLSLGFDPQGLLAYCFLRDTRIMDDAPLTGVKPIQLELQKKK